MKKFFIYVIRGIAVIAAVLAFKPIYGWLEDDRSSSFNDWLMMDNTMGYNKPCDFGVVGSVLGALFIIGIILLFVFVVTTTTKEDEK